MAQDLTGLNSLRQALTPYDDVKFELNLNRHPKAHKNKSIIYAENMKLSKDGGVLENEESIKNIDYRNDGKVLNDDNNYTNGFEPLKEHLELWINEKIKEIMNKM